MKASGDTTEEMKPTFMQRISLSLVRVQEMVFGKAESPEEIRKRKQDEELRKEVQRREALTKEKSDNVKLMKSLFFIRRKQRDADAGGEQHAGPGQVTEFGLVVVGTEFYLAVAR